MKKFTTLSWTAIISISILTCLNSCGDAEQKSGENEAESEHHEAAKDDGQGFGKFKNITLQAVDIKMAEDGQKVFESKCSACHKATDQKIVGPGLKGVTVRRQAAWILNMITNPLEMTQKDPTAKDLLAQHLTQMTFQDVSDDQAKQILEFFRRNDEGGNAQAKN